jgi:hypothetical protein
MTKPTVNTLIGKTVRRSVYTFKGFSCHITGRTLCPCEKTKICTVFRGIDSSSLFSTSYAKRIDSTHIALHTVGASGGFTINLLDGAGSSFLYITIAW